MDIHYNRNAAGHKLEELAAARRTALSNRNDSAMVHMADIKACFIYIPSEKSNAVQVEELRITALAEGRKNWRLCLREDDDEVSDEVIVRIQGILVKNNLVPKNVRSCPQHKAQFLTQSAEITGLGTTTFDAALSKMQSIENRFGEHLAGVELTNNIVARATIGEVFSASNRIFTPHQEVPTEQDNHFEEGVDPLGHLARMKRGDLIHAPENIVKYFARVENSKTKEITYKGFVPGGFNTGDIVEVQVCFVAIASGGNNVKITSRLQALTLLDNSFTKDAMKTRREVMSTPALVPAVRRRVGYFHEDDEDERQQKKSRSHSPDMD
ncbi:hypothetical protein B0H19DRAFT_1074704 [Mycena capillaripes]|nr:hypothetical protein B0H19DRAFT_1074704 [Mycena capillaripes]